MDMSFIYGAQRDALTDERNALLESVTDPAELTPEIEGRVTELNDQIRALNEKLDQARTDEMSESQARAVVFPDGGGSVRVVAEANPVYRRHDSSEDRQSYFRDLFNAGQGNKESASARDRLARSQESRALTTSATAGGTFAPPEWLVEDYIALARSARVTADLMAHDVLPGGVSSINLPQITGGTTVAVVQTQNTAVSNTDIVTSSVSSGITTISGQQVVSLQLLNQSGIPFDQVILSDLALAAASQVDIQVLSGTGANGQLKGLISAGTLVTYTSAAPAVVSVTAANSFYNKIINGVAQVATNRFLPANAIVMTPIRWGWVLEALDSNNRPLVVPNGPVYNQLAISGEPVAQGIAGTMAGLPVYVDPNIPVNLGVATNQDVVFVLRTTDNWLYETPVEQTTWEATYANQNSVLFRVNSYAAFVSRYAPSIQYINGTGLVTPTL